MENEKDATITAVREGTCSVVRDDFDTTTLDPSWVFFGTPHQPFHRLEAGKLMLKLLPRPMVTAVERGSTSPRNRRRIRTNRHWPSSANVNATHPSAWPRA